MRLLSLAVPPAAQPVEDRTPRRHLHRARFRDHPGRPPLLRVLRQQEHRVLPGPGRHGLRPVRGVAGRMRACEKGRGKNSIEWEDAAMAEQDADSLAAGYILEHFREDKPYGEKNADHLAGCPEAVVTDPDARGGTYGCDTGCDYSTFEARITCPHVDAPYEYSFGEFGELPYIIEDLAERATGA